MHYSELDLLMGHSHPGFTKPGAHFLDGLQVEAFPGFDRNRSIVVYGQSAALPCCLAVYFLIHQGADAY